MLLKRIGSFAALTGSVLIAILWNFNGFNEHHQSQMSHQSALKPFLMLHNEHEHLGKNPIHSFNHPHSFLLIRGKRGLKFVRSISELSPHADLTYNMIDQSHPIYKHLFIGSYIPTSHRFIYQPLYNTSIRAIKILKHSKNSQPHALEAIIATQHQHTPNYHLIITAEWFKDPTLYHIAQRPS